MLAPMGEAPAAGAAPAAAAEAGEAEGADAAALALGSAVTLSVALRRMLCSLLSSFSVE